VNADQFRLFGEVFVTLFVIMDPPGTIPLFLSLTSGRTARNRKKIAWQAAATALMVIVLFALFGQQILDYLHISLPRCSAPAACCCSWSRSSC
jgi:multiple antibiotic resistance protein